MMIQQQEIENKYNLMTLECNQGVIYGHHEARF